MSLSIFNARLLDPETGLDAMGSVLFKDGVISKIEPGGDKAHKGAKDAIDAAGHCLAPGLIDLRVKTGEPGNEQMETLATASRSAVAGGVTSMLVMPDTRPVIDDVALVRFISERARETADVRVYPAGALTVGLEGKGMAEIGLMSDAGAAAFSNGDDPVANASTLKRAMAYAASRDAIVMSRPDERALSGSGVMNAGAIAARIGLSGMPMEAEWIGAQRDVMLAEATGCHLLMDQISTYRSAEIAAEAKARGAKVSVTVAAHSLFFNELDIGDYLTYCKVNPPFRAEDERQGLINAVKMGLVDAIVSAHDPQPPEEKRLPFGEASFGAAGLETALSAMLSLVHDGPLDLLDALKPLTCGPADILGLPQGRLAKGAPADIILFDPDKPWVCEREALLSRSTNSPFDGRRLQGRVLKTFVSGRQVFDRGA
jgi:dihydroorotase